MVKKCLHWGQRFIFFIERMLELKHALSELEKATDAAQLENFFQIYLGKSGLVNQEFKVMLTLPDAEKKERGAKLSEIKTRLGDAYEAKAQQFKMAQINQQLEKDPIDISLDAAFREHGSYSLLAKVRREIEEVYKSMGFIIDYGHEIVTKFENFESVNIPLTHPATEMHDTFYLEEKDPSGNNLILRTHNSAHQVEDIMKYGVPLKL